MLILIQLCEISCSAYEILYDEMSTKSLEY